MSMRFVFLTHPPSQGSVSIPRFADMIMRGMKERGHALEAWTSEMNIGRLPIPTAYLRKWSGYADQFLIFPRQLRRLVQQQPDNTFFVVTDQALGMWVPYIAHRPHVIHCHDFLALKSALGEFPENPTGWTGRRYQQLILKGFSAGKAFISVSWKTQADLHGFLPCAPKISEVVHNGLNHPFRAMDKAERTSLLKKTGIEVPENGFVLHISGNQWYKNPGGILDIYRAYAASCPDPLPLWMVGAAPSPKILHHAAAIPRPGKVDFLTGLSTEQVNAAYSHARALLFPSLEEGFGWPIIEAMASDCPVITTNIAPMTEITGQAARLVPRMPAAAAERAAWNQSVAKILDELVRLEGAGREEVLNQGRCNAARFATETALDSYEKIYFRAMQLLKP